METRELQEKLSEIDRSQLDQLTSAVDGTIEACQKILENAPSENAPNELTSQIQARVILRNCEAHIRSLKSDAERLKLPEISNAAKDHSGMVKLK